MASNSTIYSRFLGNFFFRLQRVRSSYLWAPTRSRRFADSPPIVAPSLCSEPRTTVTAAAAALRGFTPARLSHVTELGLFRRSARHTQERSEESHIHRSSLITPAAALGPLPLLPPARMGHARII